MNIIFVVKIYLGKEEVRAGVCLGKGTTSFYFGKVRVGTNMEAMRERKERTNTF